MIAIQSYYSKNPLSDWEQRCWELSYNSIHKYTDCDYVKIYTNDIAFVPFKLRQGDEVVLLNDDYKEEFDLGWWQIYKQYLYSIQQESFIHVDYDLIFIKKIPELTGDIICEKRRINNTITGIEKALNYKHPKYLLCSGIMGKTTSHNLFSDTFTDALKFIREHKEIRIRNSYRWVLEESLISVKSENNTVQEIGDDYFRHFQGKLMKMNKNVHKFVYNEHKKLK